MPQDKTVTTPQKEHATYAGSGNGGSRRNTRLGGHVTDSTGTGRSGLQVVAYAADSDDGQLPRRLGSTATGDNGNFALDLDIAGDARVSLSIFGPARAHVENGHARSSEPRLLYATPDHGMRLGASEFFSFVIEGNVEQDSATRRNTPAIPSPVPNAASIRFLSPARAKKHAKMFAQIHEQASSLLSRPRGQKLFATRADVSQKHAAIIADDVAEMRRNEHQAQGHWVSVEDVLGAPLQPGTDPQSIAALLPAVLDHGTQKPVSTIAPERKNTVLDQCRKSRSMRLSASGELNGNGVGPAASGEPSPGGNAIGEPTTDSGDGATVGDSGDGAAGNGTSVPDALAELRRAALAMALGDEPGALPESSTDQSVNGRLQSSLSGGPADQTAHHDFHSLRIAFRDMWSSLADRKLATELARLYASMVSLENDYDLRQSDAEADGHDPDSLPAELSELDDLLKRIEDSVGQLEMISVPPAYLETWAPELKEAWSYLTPATQARIQYLYWLQQDVRPFVIGAESTPALTSEDEFNPLSWYVDAESRALRIPLPGTFYAIAVPDFAWSFLAETRIGDLFMRSAYIAEERNRILAAAEGYEIGETPTVGRLREMLKAVQLRRQSPHRFDVFAPGSYNFGIVLTWRQEWKPLSYQAGKLVATIPLAPGETRKYSKSEKVVTKRSQREIEKSLSSRRFESTETRKAESEIIRKARMSSQFSSASDGSIEVPTPIGKVGSSSQREFGVESGSDSAATKSGFRDAVKNALSEYKDEHTLEVHSEEDVTTERSESGEISNPNNEIPVTYLFYELQRRYRIRELLHRVTPVVLVAMDVPAPEEINESWLLEHDWILRRVILDDRLIRPLDQLADTFTGDEAGVEVLRKQWETLMSLVSELKQDLRGHVASRAGARSKLNRLTKTAADAGEDVDLMDIVSRVLFREGPIDAEAQSRIDAAEQLLAWVESDFAAAEGRLRNAVTDLQAATKSYVAGLRARLNRRTAIDQLLLHVKQNIIHYMHAIWSHEPPDQRYFRLYDLPIAFPSISGECRVRHETIRTVPSIDHLGRLTERHYVRVRCPAPFLGQSRNLSTIADLSRPLGFKGNYAIFPLTTQNGITEFMMQDYLHDFYGVYDPDPTTSELDPDDLQTLATCMDGSHLDDVDTPNAQRLKDLLLDVIDLGTTAEEITVPTGQLFIEALTGSHTVLEEFKLRHRQADVAAVWADVRSKELNNIRLASRIAAGDLSDPDIEKRIEIANPVASVNVDPDA